MHLLIACLTAAFRPSDRAASHSVASDIAITASSPRRPPSQPKRSWKTANFVAHPPTHHHFFPFPNEYSPEAAIRGIHSMKLTVESGRLDRAAVVGRICNAGSQRLQRGEEGQMDRGHQISVGTNDYFRPHKWKENRGQTENLLVFPRWAQHGSIFFWQNFKKGEKLWGRGQLVGWQLQINSFLF